jgi:hypothetical protein
VALLLVTIMCQARVVTIVAAAHQGRLAFRDALRISALGTLGNALGGLPLGAALKYGVLYRRCGLSLLQITVGFGVSGALVSVGLLVWVAGVAWLVPMGVAARWISVGLLAIAGLGWMLLHQQVERRAVVASNVGGLLREGIRCSLVSTNAAISVLLVLNGWVLGRSLYPDVGSARLILATATGLFAGLASLLQSVGGVHELAMGASAQVSGFPAIDGLRLGLVMRASSVLGAGAALLLLQLSTGRGGTGR